MDPLQVRAGLGQSVKLVDTGGRPLSNLNHVKRRPATLKAIAGYCVPSLPAKCVRAAPMMAFWLALGLVVVWLLRHLQGARRVTEGDGRTVTRRLLPVPASELAAAVAIATSAVPIMAWCSLPIDKALTSTSMSLVIMALPLDGIVNPRASATNATYWLCWRAAAFFDVLNQPIFTAP